MSRTTGCQNQLKIRAIITVPLHENRGVLAKLEERKKLQLFQKSLLISHQYRKLYLEKMEIGALVCFETMLM